MVRLFTALNAIFKGCMKKYRLPPENYAHPDRQTLRLCVYCHKMFMSPGEGLRYKFCSEKCWYAFHHKRKTFEGKRCEHCQNIFVPTMANQKFCSKQCKETFHYKKQNIEKECPICGTKFVGSTKKIYCSGECKALAR